MPRFQGIPVEGATKPRFGGLPVDTIPAVAERPAPVAPMGMEHQPAPKSGFDIFTGKSRETRATRELPELGTGGLLSGESPATVAKIAPLLLVTTDPREMGDILSTVPGIGIIDDEKGNLIAANNKTGAQVVINQPGISQLDIMQMIGIGSAFTPAAAGATAAVPIAATGKQILARGVVGGVGAGLTETAMQAGQEAAGGEFDPADVALATSLGLAAEVAVPVIQKLRMASRAKAQGVAADELADIAPTIREAEAAQAGVEATTGRKIPLFQAQKTTVPAQLEKQAFIGQLPAGTQKATTQLRAQNKEIAGAVEDFLGTIAPPESIVTGPEKFRTAAQSAVRNAKRIRSEKASPLYNQAFTEGANINLKPVRDAIKTGLDDFPAGGEVSRSLARINGLLKGSKGKSPTLKQLHNAKLEIDQMINKVGESSLGNTTKAELRTVKDILLDQMDDGSALYNEARKTFELASPPVTKMQESIIGKMADIDDVQLKAISRRIFDPAETNPTIIKQAKKAISDIDPDAWNQLLRTELERRMGAVRADLTGVNIENVPGQLHRALFGNTKQRAVLLNSVDGEMKQNLKYLETELKRASMGRPGGSPTATREEIKRELRGGSISAIRNFFKAPVSTLVSTGEDAAFNKRVKSLADAMFDPQWKPRMKELRKLSPNTPAAARAMTQLLNDVDKQERK
jgi:hypothetical protein